MFLFNNWVVGERHEMPSSLHFFQVSIMFLDSLIVTAVKWGFSLTIVLFFSKCKKHCIIGMININKSAVFCGFVNVY